MHGARLHIVVFALVLASFAGCERPSGGEGTRAVEAGTPATATLEPASDAWLGFRPYPAARQLCQQFVDGFSGDGRPAGGQWMSFASRDAAATVAAFYDASASEGRGFEVRQPGGRILSIHGVAADYPSCAEKPRSGEKTVIVVSQFYSSE